MIAPDPPTELAASGPGIFAEVRDHLDQTLFRANISSQVGLSVETFSPDGAIQRVDAPSQRRVILLVVPDPPEARSLVVTRRAQGQTSGDGRFAARPFAEDQELMRVSLDEE